MILKVVLPETDLSISEWFDKHMISSSICPPDIAIARALDSLDNALIYKHK